jgi:hypothetical protein
VAPRRSSSSQTARRDSSSNRPGRSRAAWIREGSRPVGVEQRSPAGALQVGQARSSQPLAT